MSAKQENVAFNIATIRQIRNPEARSNYSELLASHLRIYLDQIFHQDNLPEGLRLFSQHNGIILFEGSLSRGTVTERTADLDMFFVYDDLNNPDVNSLISIGCRDIEEAHADSLSFPQYLVNNKNTTPDLKAYYYQRIEAIRLRQQTFDSIHNQVTQMQNIDESDLLHFDPGITTIQSIKAAIEEGSKASLKIQDVPSRIILSLLTSSLSHVYEFRPRQFQSYQREIIQSLNVLHRQQPQKFTEFWNELESDFINLHRSTAARYPERDFQLLAEHIIKKGLITLSNVSTEDAVKISAFNLTVPIVFEHYDQLMTEYKDDPPAYLMKSFTNKYGLESGINREGIQAIVKGQVYKHPKFNDLSNEAQSEILLLQKKVRLLKAFRSSLKLPSLEEFNEAFGIK